MWRLLFEKYRRVRDYILVIQMDQPPIEACAKSIRSTHSDVYLIKHTSFMLVNLNQELNKAIN